MESDSCGNDGAKSAGSPQAAKAAPPLRLSGVIPESIVDGPGIRLVVFVQGCPHGCPGCHNPQTHDFAGGYEAANEDISAILKEVTENPLLGGVTFSGGEPFCQPEALSVLASAIKSKAPGLSLMVYSGYTYEALSMLENNRPAVGRLLDTADILVDGPYIEAKRDLTLRYRGSANQRVIDLKKTRKAGTVVLYQEDYCQGFV